MMLNIAHISARRDPKVEWYLDSLWIQWRDAGQQPPIKLIFVDHYADDPGRREMYLKAAAPFIAAGVEIKHVPVKPNVWQGKHRLTTRDYWAASNVRNTAICLCDDGHVAFVDDLGVLMPGWLQQVCQSAREGWIACGAYIKAMELVVRNGEAISFRGLPERGLDMYAAIPEQVFSAGRIGNMAGVDSRLNRAPQFDDPHPCTGSWMFGSCAVPVEALLAICGYDEDCDSMSSEDYIAGIMLEQHGYKFKYCRRMLTIESEELHGLDTPPLRIIKGPPNDKRNKSHVILDLVASGRRHTAPNYFGPEGIRGLRKRILAGEPFPIVQVPDRDWYDGQELRTM